MEWLQKIYIWVLTPFCGLSEKIDSKIKKGILYIVCFLLYLTCYCWYSIIGLGTPLTLLSRMLESIALIVILIFIGLEKPLKLVRWNKLVIYTWFTLGILIFIMGFFNEQNTGYWMTGPVIALGLPCFYMVYGESRKYEIIFDAICKSAIIISIIYFFICILGESFSDNVWDLSNRYNGLTIDANKIGELCLASFCCIIYFWHVNKNRIWNIVSVISIGMIIGQVYLTQSRTTILAMIFIIGFSFIMYLKDAVCNKQIYILAKPIIMFGIVLMISVVAVNIVDKTHSNYLESAVEAEETISVSEETTVGENIVSQDENSLSGTEPTVSEYRDMLPEKGMDMNSFSSGRLFIWQTYADGFNWIGNPADAAEPISPLIKQRTAHNSIVEITYRSGYITGAVYVLLVIITAIYILKVMFRRNDRNTKGDYFMAIASIGYLIFTSLMSSFNPLTAIIFLLYAIAFPVLLDRNKENV